MSFPLCPFVPSSFVRSATQKESLRPCDTFSVFFFFAVAAAAAAAAAATEVRKKEDLISSRTDDTNPLSRDPD